MFKRAIDKATPEQQARQDRCRELGCVACWMNRISTGLWETTGQWVEIHHQTISGRQIGQDETIALCIWHHCGILIPLFTTTLMEAKYGPSLMSGSKTFVAAFGSNSEQLDFQNWMLTWQGN